MIAVAASDAQANGGYFGAIHINPWGVRVVDGGNVEVFECIDNAVFKLANQLAAIKFETLNIQQRVDHELTWTMVGYLSASVGVNNWYAMSVEYVLSFAGFTLREYWFVLHEPELVWVGIGHILAMLFHGLPGGFVGLQFAVVDDLAWCAFHDVIISWNGGQMKRRSLLRVCAEPLIAAWCE